MALPVSEPFANDCAVTGSLLCSRLLLASNVVAASQNLRLAVRTHHSSTVVITRGLALTAWSTLQVNKKLEEVLDNKNQIIKALKYDIAKVSKAHNDLIRVYEAKLAEFGIPAEELGFRPLVTNTAPGPAGLVVGA